MLACLGLGAGAAWSAPPDALDVEFLDYLAAVEDESGNWTDVAEDSPAGREGERTPAPPAKDAGTKDVGDAEDPQ